MKKIKLIILIIFLAILLMGIIIIINNNKNVMPQPERLSEEALKKMFNNQFTYYEGNIKGNMTRGLLQKTIATNNEGRWQNKKVEVISWIDSKKSSDNEFISNLISQVDSESIYTVTFDYNNEGWITCINIEQN